MGHLPCAVLPVDLQTLAQGFDAEVGERSDAVIIGTVNMVDAVQW